MRAYNDMRDVISMYKSHAAKSEHSKEVFFSLIMLKEGGGVGGARVYNQSHNNIIASSLVPRLTSVYSAI